MMQVSNAQFYIRSNITSTQGVGTTFLIAPLDETSANLETGTDTITVVLKTTTQVERMEITATGGVATIVLRGLTESETQTANVGYQKAWNASSKIYTSPLAFDLLAKRYAKPLRIKIPTVADDTARGVLYPSPTGGEKVMNTANGGKEEVYNAVTAQWEAAGTSTAVGNATAAAAGIVQVATHAKAVAGDDTGSTGATNSVPPSELAATQQSGTFIYAAASDVSDTYTANLTPAITAYTTGMLVRIKFTTANTGACTINLNGLGAKSIKTSAVADPGDGTISAGLIADLIYDGTNFVIQSCEIATLTEMKTGTADKPVPASLAKCVVGTALAYTTTTINAGGSSATYSSSQLFANGGFASIDFYGNTTTGINVNRFGFQTSPNNSDWTTQYTEDYAGGASAGYLRRTLSYTVPAGYYLRVFAGGIGSNTAAVTASMRCQVN